MYHLHLIKRRHLDERKTLTKVSTCRPLTNIPQNKSAHLGTRKPGKTYANSKTTGKRSRHGRNQRKEPCIIGGVVPPTMNSPVVAPPPMPKSAVTAEERTRVIDFTKTQVLPDANSSALIKCEKNNATRVLAAAIYSVLEKKFFDTVLPRADVATAFHCNTSQLSKALTGIEYASGPHQYTPKKSATKKRPAEEGEQSTTAKTQKKTTMASRDDTLSTPSTSDSDTPLPDVFFKQKSKRRANLLLLTFNTYLIIQSHFRLLV